jgi:hypothetical protein
VKGRHLSRCALLVDAFKILLEAAVSCIHLSSALVQFCKLMQYDVFMVATGHCSAIALGCSIITFDILMLIAVAYRYLHNAR